MFYLEINFADGISSTEIMFVRRSYFSIGSEEHVNVVLEGTSFPYELRIFRGLGRKFHCKVVNIESANTNLPLGLEQSYDASAEFDLKEVNLKIAVLDSDLIFKTEESADRAACRIFKTAISKDAPKFPALVLNGACPVVQSFNPENSLIIGKSRKADFRLEGDSIANEHLKLEYKNGKCFLENLNQDYISKINGETFGQYREIEFGDNISLGNAYAFNVVIDENALNRIPNLQNVALKELGKQNVKSQFPCLISKSDKINPKRTFINNFTEIKIGRDPTSHIWINAPHISRDHLLIQREDTLKIFIKDTSTNGTLLNSNKLPMVERTELPNSQLSVIGLGTGYEIAVCYTKEQEDAFLNDNYSDYLAVEKQQETVTHEGKEDNIDNFNLNEVDLKENNEHSFEEIASEQFVSKESPMLEDSYSNKFDLENKKDILGHTSKLGVVTKEDLIEKGILEEDPNKEELLVTEDFYEQEIRTQKKFKFITIGFIFLLVAFCLMLIVGFLSDNYFY